jgi:hypothetical protein
MGICRPLSSGAVFLRHTIFRRFLCSGGARGLFFAPKRAGYQQVEQIGLSLGAT